MVSKHGETAFQRFPEYVIAKKLTKKDFFLQLRSELCDDGTGKANNGIETRYELLLGFSESVENQGLFSEMTGLY